MTLTLHNLHFAYTPDRPVLRNLSTTFAPGRLTAVVGPNGAGKSTLLRLLIGALSPTSGRITLDDADLSTIPAARRARRLAYVAQRPSLAAAFTVRETVALGRFSARPQGATACPRYSAASRATAQNTPDHRSPIDRALADLDLADRADDLFQTLSVGQQQRAALARALCQLAPPHTTSDDRTPAQALIVDEPTAALDPRHALHTMQLLRRTAAHDTAFQGGEAGSQPTEADEGGASGGRIVIAAIHDLTAARRFADDALVLTERGEIAAAGPAADTLIPAILEPVFRVRFLELKMADTGQVAIVPAAPAQSR